MIGLLEVDEAIRVVRDRSIAGVLVTGAEGFVRDSLGTVRPSLSHVIEVVLDSASAADAREVNEWIIAVLEDWRAEGVLVELSA